MESIKYITLKMIVLLFILKCQNKLTSQCGFKYYTYKRGRDEQHNCYQYQYHYYYYYYYLPLLSGADSKSFS